MTSTEIVSAVSAEYARSLTDKIKVAVEGTWHLITEAYTSRAWSALGYSSWDDYCTREFGTSRLRLPREERAETVQSLREAGLSLRAIASATGDSKDTIARALSPVSNETPDPESTYEPSGMDEFTVDRSTGEVIAEVLAEVQGPEPVSAAEKHPTVTGIDGKSYQPSASRKPPRKPLVEVAKSRGFALRQAMDSVLKLTEDDRYRTNEKQVADVLRGHLLYVAETVAAVLDQLP